jgi:hypothetical protein
MATCGPFHRKSWHLVWAFTEPLLIIHQGDEKKIPKLKIKDNYHVLIHLKI